MVSEESTSSSSRVPCNQRDQHVSAWSKLSDRSEEEISIEDPPKASRDRSFSVPPSAELFARHPGILRTEATDVVTRARAWTASSCDDASRYHGTAASTGAESREATGRADGRRTGGASESTSQCAPPTPTAVARCETRPSKRGSARGGLATCMAIPKVDEQEEERKGESTPIPTSGGGRKEEMILSHQEFGLRRWKEYALLR